LLGGRLLPPRLLAEMTTPVDTGIPGLGYGLGVTVLQAPLIQAEGRLIGHDGGIPGFLNEVLSTEDGRRQQGVMVNELFAPPSIGASLRAALRAGAPAATAQALDRTRVRLALRAQR
jgi:hypothetical protein